MGLCFPVGSRQVSEPRFRVWAEPSEAGTISHLLGWRWRWELRAWDEEEGRWRPPAFVVRTNLSLAAVLGDYHGLARSKEQALARGRAAARRWREEATDYEAEQIRRRYLTQVEDV